MCSTDLRQKREKYSLIVDYILYFAKKQSWWFCRLLLFCLAGSMCAGRPRFLGFVHPEEERKVRVRLAVILDALLHQVFPSLSRWKGSRIQFVGLVDVSTRAGLITRNLQSPCGKDLLYPAKYWNSAHSTGLQSEADPDLWPPCGGRKVWGEINKSIKPHRETAGQDPQLQRSV